MTGRADRSDKGRQKGEFCSEGGGEQSSWCFTKRNGGREREIEADRERLQPLLHPADQFTTP